MLKHANREAAPAARVNMLPPGIYERARALQEARAESDHVKDLKAQVRDALRMAASKRDQGFELAASSLEQDIVIPMRRLIEMGAF